MKRKQRGWKVSSVVKCMAALPETAGSIPNIHMAAHKHLQLKVQGIHPLQASVGISHTQYRHVRRQNSHSHKIKLKKKKPNKLLSLKKKKKNKVKHNCSGEHENHFSWPFQQILKLTIY